MTNKPLPGLEVPAISDRRLPLRIGDMHRRFGRTEGRCCASCVHLVVHKPGQNKYYKCDLTVITSGPGTDWRIGWPACGRWEAGQHRTV